MMTARPEYAPAQSLCKRWVATYNEFLFQVAALRELTRHQAQLGLLREQLVDRATHLTDLADQLMALGYRPHELFAGAEARLWAETLKLVHSLAWQTPPLDAPADLVKEDLDRMNDGWKRFTAFVDELPVDFFTHLPTLNPQLYRGEGLLRLVGQRRQAAVAANGVRPDHIV
jgi:hypothetical protein